MFREFVCVSILVILVLLSIYQQRRWNRLCARYRQLEGHADAMLQHGQGVILNMQGVVSELSLDDPVRVRAEQALSRAERGLAGMRESIESDCSKRQQDAIQ